MSVPTCSNEPRAARARRAAHAPNPLGPAGALLAVGLLLVAACGTRAPGSRTLRSAAEALSAQRYAESAVLFEQAQAEATTAEERARASFGLAEVSFAQGQHEPALELYRALAADATLPARLRLAAQEGAGRSLRALGRRDEARETLVGFFRMLREVSGVERLSVQEQDVLLRPLARLEADATYALGLTLYELGELAPAAEAIARVVALLPPGLEQAQAYKILAHADREAGRRDAALQNLGHAYVVTPADPPGLRCALLLDQVEIYRTQDNRLAAVQALGRAAQLCPDSAPIREQSQAVLAALGPDELRSLLARYPHEPPGDAATLRLAEVLAEQGDLRAAIDLLRSASADFPGSPLAAAFADELRNLEQSLVVEPRKLGFVGPLSGFYALPGEDVRSGAALAVQEHNALHPRDRFELIERDSASGPEGAAGAVRELAQQQRVIAVIGPVTTTDVQQSSALIEQLGVPAVSPSATGEGLSGPQHYVFRAGLIRSHQIRRLADFAVRSLGLRTFAVLYPDSRYGHVVRQEFVDAVQTYGGAVVAQAPYPERSNDFKGPLLQIKPAAPQAVFLPGSPGEVGAIAAELVFHDMSPAVLATNVINSADGLRAVLQAGDKHAEGIYFVDDYFQDSAQPLAQAFLSRYRDEYGRAPSRVAAQGYDTARLLLLKILESGSRANRALLARQLASTASFPSVTGLRGFDANGEAIKELKVLGISDGRVVQVQGP